MHLLHHTAFGPLDFRIERLPILSRESAKLVPLLLRIGVAQPCRVIEGPIWGIVGGAGGERWTEMLDGSDSVGGSVAQCTNTAFGSDEYAAIGHDNTVVDLRRGSLKRVGSGSLHDYLWETDADGEMRATRINGAASMIASQSINRTGIDVGATGFLIRPKLVVYLYPARIMKTALAIFFDDVTNHDILDELSILQTRFQRLFSAGK